MGKENLYKICKKNESTRLLANTKKKRVWTELYSFSSFNFSRSSAMLQRKPFILEGHFCMQLYRICRRETKAGALTDAVEFKLSSGSPNYVSLVGTEP